MALIRRCCQAEDNGYPGAPGYQNKTLLIRFTLILFKVALMRNKARLFRMTDVTAKEL